MQPFHYIRPESAEQAVEAGRRDAARFVAGGTMRIRDLPITLDKLL